MALLGIFRALLEYCKPGYWRHLVLLGLLGVLRWLWITNPSRFQSPCKPDNCCVCIMNTDIRVYSVCVPSQIFSVPQTVTTCASSCTYTQQQQQQQGRWRRPTNACFHGIVNINARLGKLWNNIATQPVSKHNAFVNSMSLTSTTPCR